MGFQIEGLLMITYPKMTKSGRSILTVPSDRSSVRPKTGNFEMVFVWKAVYFRNSLPIISYYKGFYAVRNCEQSGIKMTSRIL